MCCNLSSVRKYVLHDNDMLHTVKEELWAQYFIPCIIFELISDLAFSFLAIGRFCKLGGLGIAYRSPQLPT